MAGVVAYSFSTIVSKVKTIRMIFGYPILYTIVSVNANLRKLHNPKKNNFGELLRRTEYF